MKNKLSYLGFLGFFGFLSPFAFLGDYSSVVGYFFGFFFFFMYAKVVPDELFIQHVRIAATRAFFVGLILGIIVTLSVLILENLAVIRFLVTISLFIPFGTFLISLEIFEHREKKGMQNAS
ncbi:MULTISPECIES: DUF3796 domain-containing protein [Bacillus]|uniref:DUF3796 domain-containing protein n=1 Tax=Bacillus wiedmannii TaxID=1890302 RepID=A0A2B5PEH8_9BACI|nr:DUF3796 domain-containing protein [Bacillus wiedmannii]PEM52935.1 hypothetical protein CN618_06865 [Bacillus wiedmannii]PEP99033.1 hypothetical protein CN587_30010 [Bacillus wiedmannii]PFZ18833.1 hypothetical protein COL66_29760 [Bacillus wiedmannii]PFZ96440.1 hypothetical protein COL78_16285 [Bacillus wiedmannii]PHC80734.1 hypothetical protein COF42_29570 [Bacillus wiedmannii]